MMVDLGEKFIIHINSEKGEKLVTGLDYIKEATEADMDALERVREAKKKIFKEEFIGSLPKVYDTFDKSFASPVWKDVGRRCVACGNCTAVCPTCYCFDVRDETQWNLHDGVRCRVWDGCLLRDFATVSGGHNFRKNKAERYRHRYYRKGKYVPEKIGEISCVGCGRCIAACVTKIANPVEVYNRLLEKK